MSLAMDTPAGPPPPAAVEPVGLDLSGLDRPGSRIVSLIPAHNEEDGIVKTVRSQFAQSIQPALVIVMADNCTDDTVRLAREAGAQVVETVDNRAKKAGALNQGLAMVMPLLDDDDYILAQDADGELGTDFIKNALWAYEVKPNLGGVSGCIVARTPTNFIERAQAIEYARGTRLMGRQGGKVHVLSGAAALFPVRVFRAIAEARGTTLPGAPGTVYMEDSLTEDYELTLAIRHLGFDCTSTKRCPVVTDIMPDIEMLQVQRLRWYRGAMESLWLYGWNRITRSTWGGVAFTFFSSLLFPLALLALVLSWLLWDIGPNPLYWFLLPIFMAENIVVAMRIKDRASLRTAIFFVPLWLYDNAMFIVYWRALFGAVRREARVWVT
ncbi:glycosyltransferase family 2 protein [Citricoccus sp. SGAir0253]|uniref:glycosyltransferase family 2 protein n=1 Tax=Citricoccus sp. SGAir0253 TaxID=2567881 RepID=UPI0010CD2F4E|nr:glycosyltransferase family 2 protein [Citricoccus sp. SGAir0253]QCU77648.1 glycosyltransferase family 2 protein [Citricoccus sp. SGAir0253]